MLICNSCKSSNIAVGNNTTEKHLYRLCKDCGSRDIGKAYSYIELDEGREYGEELLDVFKEVLELGQEDTNVLEKQYENEDVKGVPKNTRTSLEMLLKKITVDENFILLTALGLSSLVLIVLVYLIYLGSLK